MIETLCGIRQVFAYSLIPLMVLSGVLMLFIKNTKYKRLAYSSIFLLLAVGLIVLTLNRNIESKIREEIKLKLNETGVVSIKINNAESTIESNLLTKELLKIESKSTRRGTGRAQKIKLELIKDNTNYSFYLFRNSFEPNKYQVTTNEYNYELDIGMIITNILDNENNK